MEILESPYKAYRVYIWEPEYSTIIYAKSASQAKSKYYNDGEFGLDFFDAVRQMVVRREKDRDINQPLEYINRRYGTSFIIGQHIIADNARGWIIGEKNGYVKVGHGNGREWVYHPSDVKAI